ncbi:MAG TPA: response regulator transcription factor [Polyangiaceae bacterium]|nr:response regulator transcription factor [Polyangiaceae bacterium]
MASPGDNNGTTRTILVIEDDPSITMGLELNLRAEGYSVILAHDGEEGLTKARKEDIDLLILDVMLPRLNGFEVLRVLRGEGSEIPVLMLSARGAEMDKVMGLELGAEDYVTKPFGLAELLARVRAILRRDGKGRGMRSPVFRSGVLEINADTRQVLRDGKEVELTATEFDVLLCLVEAKGRVLSREQIQANVWGPDHHGTTRTVDNFLLQLRAKLEVDPTEPKHLVTVRGVGYRFVP